MSAVPNAAFLRRVVGDGLLDEVEVRRLTGGGEDALPVVRHILALRLLPRKDCLMRWCEGLGTTWIDLGLTLVDPKVMRLLPKEVAERQDVLLLYQLGEKVTAVMANPRDAGLVAKLAAMAGRPLSVVAALPEAIQEAIQLNYVADEDLQGLEAAALRKARPELRDDEEDVAAAARSEEIVRLTDTLLALAIREGASDVHLSPHESDSHVRFRVDGLLRTKLRIAVPVHHRAVSRIKFQAGMNITERRKPQDGRLVLELPTRRLEFRVSTVPSLYGENMVLRAIASSSGRGIPALNTLDLGADNLTRLESVLTGRAGLVLVVGPTGSGKTTTLFSALNSLDRSGLNILTVEEPIEYILPGATQVAVNRAANLGFAEVLRAFLRQDPDVILIGEIRDRESLELAIEAALTGHLVLASMHSNDAVQCLTRLRQLGAQNEWLGSTLLTVVAQRLLPRICVECRSPYRPEERELERHFTFSGNPGVSYYRGAGCAACSGTGFKGRVAIHEVVTVTAELRDTMIAGARPAQISAAAEQQGFRSLRYDGLKKVLRGLITIEELERSIAE